MTALLLAGASGLAAWAAMAVLCYRSASQRHRLGLPELDLGQRRRRAAAATLLLAVSLAAATLADGAAFGLLLWLCQAGLLGLALICLLPYAAAAVKATAGISAPLAPLLLCAALWP